MTLLDGLHHGTPTVCLRGGPTFRSSMAHAIYGLLGLQDRFIAADKAEYLRLVVALAKSARQCQALREELPRRLQASTLCDAQALTGELEALYQQAVDRQPVL